MTRSTIPAAAMATLLAVPAGAGTELSDAAFAPLVEAKIATGYSAGAEPILMPGGVERLNGIRVTGEDWFFTGEAVQLEPADRIPEIFIENARLSTASRVTIDLEVMAAFAKADLFATSGSDVAALQMLLDGTPGDLEAACPLVSSPLSGMAENVVYRDGGRRIGSVTGLTASFEMTGPAGDCDIEAGLYVGEIEVGTGTGTETGIELATIVVAGPAGNSGAREVTLEIDGIRRIRGGEETMVGGVDVRLTGDAGRQAQALLGRILRADIGATHALVDLALDAGR